MKDKHSWYFDNSTPPGFYCIKPENFIKIITEHDLDFISRYARDHSVDMPGLGSVMLSWSRQPINKNMYPIDIQLLSLVMKYCEPHHDIFLEAGASNGVTQSNTAILEYMLSWSGHLVEPIEMHVQTCKKTRKLSEVYYGAFVEKEYSKDLVEGPFDDSIIDESGRDLTTGLDLDIQERYKDFKKKVPAIKIHDILEKIDDPKRLGVLSLDLEGNEDNILRQIDFSIYKPRIVIVEAFEKTEKLANIEEFMISNNYSYGTRIDSNDVVYIHREGLNIQ